MSDTVYHPEPERLEALAAGDVAAGDAAVLESHLLECARCRGEVEEWRGLFDALARLPALAPAAGFADAVMARVRVPQPLGARVWRLLERLVPRSRGAWALVGVALAAPTLGLTGLMAWILAHPWLTLQGLLGFAARQLGAAIASLPQRGLGLVADTTIGVWLAQALEWLAGVGAGSIGAAAALAATLVAASAWILYENLFRHETRSDRYANYCF